MFFHRPAALLRLGGEFADAARLPLGCFGIA
jgi:hypothetical protein